MLLSAVMGGMMGAMLGVVLSENLIQLLMFWELTSLASFLLIGYWKEREAARQGARMARETIRFASSSPTNRSARGSHFSLRPRRMQRLAAWQMVVARWAASG